MKVLSLFDGMACGMIAMNLAGVDVESYDAYEIDKYAVKTAQHNFPMIREHGDVFVADFTQYEGIDFMVGGSPCTYWSIAQTKNRETVASGIGWELFSQYVRALHEAKPKYFIYENNKSMSKEIRASIDKEFGFEAVCINSALVSAQNRQRLYWVGKRNADGTYSKVNVEQPDDRGILLRDILETGTPWQDKVYNLTTRCNGAIPSDTLKRHRHTMIAEPVCLRYECTEEAKRCRKAYEAHEIKHGYNELNELHPRPDGKTNTLTTVLKDNQIMEPVCVAERGRYIGGDGEVEQHLEARNDGKTNTLTTVQKDNQVAEPIRIGTIENDAKNQKFDSQQYRVYSPDGKSVTLCGNGGGVGAKTGLYAVPVDCPNRKYPVYEVCGGLITIKDKQYPIKLTDGYYIIRKLSVTECKRLQTVPDNYEFPVSNSQAYKMLGNGWTCEVIAHLIRSALMED